LTGDEFEFFDRSRKASADYASEEDDRAGKNL